MIGRILHRVPLVSIASCTNPAMRFSAPSLSRSSTSAFLSSRGLGTLAYFLGHSFSSDWADGWFDTFSFVSGLIRVPARCSTIALLWKLVFFLWRIAHLTPRIFRISRVQFFLLSRVLQVRLTFWLCIAVRLLDAPMSPVLRCFVRRPAQRGFGVSPALWCFGVRYKTWWSCSIRILSAMYFCY